jgi:hypothetical protein
MILYKKFITLFFAIFLSYMPLYSITPIGESPSRGLSARTAPQAKKTQVQQTMEYYKFKENYDILYTLDVTHGFNDKIAIEVIVPYFVKRRSGPNTSNGLSNIFTGFDWTFFKASNSIALIKFGPTLPTGGKSKNPTVESGTVGTMFEFDFIHDVPHWYFETDWNALINTPRKHNTKIGNVYNYNFIFGRTVHLKLSDLHFLFELKQFYFARDKIRGVEIDSSGSSVIILGPLIAWHKQDLIAQMHFQLPIGQNVFGGQPELDLRIALSFQFAF